MKHYTIGTMLVMALACAWSASSARAQEPVWYPPSEPSPFIPDDARRITGGTGKTVHFRGTWQIDGPVERAVLMTAPMQTTAS